jgi:phthalate 4,5-dioxygenase
MGELIRRCWTPVCLSEELPEPDCDPIRIRLLGEDLIAFRDSDGRVGVMDEHCPHRGASLFFGRNEEGGLRCLYHGWKIDTAGTILDTPCEPAESRMRFHIKHAAFPTVERAEVVWAYLGPRDEEPPFPNFWWMNLPAENRAVGKIEYTCNFVQAMEGVWDSMHSNFLHAGFQVMHWTDEQIANLDRGEFGFFPTTPFVEIEDTPYGFRAAHIHEQADGSKVVGVRPFVVPFHSLLSDTPHMFVPEDDEHTWLFDVRASVKRPVDREAALRSRGERVGPDLTPDHRKIHNAENNYLQDRKVMRERTESWSYSGIPWGKPTQDMAMTESMGPIWERWKEHLGSSDLAVMTLRSRLLTAVRGFMATGTVAELDPAIQIEQIVGVSRVTIPGDAPWQSVCTPAGDVVPERA